MKRPRLLVLGLLLLAHVGQVAAHAFLIETQPEDSVQLSVPPAQIVLRFNEAVTPARVELRNDRDTVLTGADDWTVEADTVRLTVPEIRTPGVYRVTWRVTSADGHPASGY